VSATNRNPPQRSALSFLWFPVLFAIILPITLEAAFHHPTSRHMPIAMVGTTSQVRDVSAGLAHAVPAGFDVRRVRSVKAAATEVRDRTVAAAYVANRPSGTLYVAAAASSIRASYVETVFGRIAAHTRAAPPQTVNLVPLQAGDGGTGVFFFLFPLMMVGVIGVIILLQTPWSLFTRMGVAAGVGALATASAYLTVIGFNVLPGKPLLIPYEFLLTQAYAQLFVGGAVLLRQYFLPVSMTIALILSVPSAGATVPPDLMPPVFRDLSYVMPLAQGVRFTRSIAYFRNASLFAPTAVLLGWLLLAACVLSTAWVRQTRARKAVA
jgi:hypothetical protein